jgi:hypothetical protein
MMTAHPGAAFVAPGSFLLEGKGMKTGSLMKESINAKRFIMVVLGALLLAVQLGCGGEDGGATTDRPQTEDEKQIYALVGGVSDKAAGPEASENLKRLRESFTKENAPSGSQLKTYQDHMFEISSPINVTGNTASFTVKIAKYTATDVGIEKQWKAVKEGDVWKLSETPLP